jgi:hypothetical protein
MLYGLPEIFVAKEKKGGLTFQHRNTKLYVVLTVHLITVENLFCFTNGY